MLRVILLSAVFTGVAWADEVPVPADPAAEPEAAEPAPPPPPTTKKPISAAVRLSHYHQIQASLRLALGLRAIAPYDTDVYCGDTDNTRANGFAAVCTGRSPFALDFELGFGIARKVDAFLELRLGLESDFGRSQNDTEGTHQFHLSPGARFFYADAGSSKLFTTAQIVLDTTSYHNVGGGKLSADFGFRNLNGLWFDLDKAYGFYLFVGETASFARWLQFELEGGVGIQGRYR